MITLFGIYFTTVPVISASSAVLLEKCVGKNYFMFVRNFLMTTTFFMTMNLKK